MRRIGTVDSQRKPLLRGPRLSLGWLPLGLPLSVAAVAAGIFLALTVALQVTYADRVPAGVRAIGVDLGGRTRAEAQGLLRTEVAAQQRKSVVLRTDNQSWQVGASDLGLSADAELLAERAYEIGRQGNPVQRATDQWSALIFGQRVRDAGLVLDDRKVEATLTAIGAEVDRPPLDARIFVERSGEDPRVVVSREQRGSRISIPVTIERLRDAVVRGLPAEIDLAIEVAPPNVTAADLLTAKGEAERMLSSPLTLTLESRRWTVSRDEIARMVTFEQSSEGTHASVNVDALADRWDRISREVGHPAVDARFEWVAGNLRVIRESQDGRGLDMDWLRSQARQYLLGTDRSLPLVVGPLPPAISSGDGPKLGIRELVRDGRTSFPGSVAEKQHNIRLAASRLHGVVVAPGGTFSFNREVGPTTLEAGFQSGWGITISSTGARTVPSVAGGICQVATTLFQPVFHAGYTIEERHAHLYWIQSYGQAPLGMKGLDATVDEDYGLDMQFINSTPDYLLVQARVEGTNLIFGLYGTKPSWDVKIEGPMISNVVPADRTPVSRLEPTMPPGRRLQVEAAQDGFDVTVARTVTQGSDVRTLRLRSHYVPSQNVALYGPGAEPTPTAVPTPLPPSSSAVPAQVGPNLPTPAPTQTPRATVVPAQ